MTTAETIPFAAVGAGFWARYQLAGWREVPGASCVALCDRDLARARRLADELQIPRVYSDPGEMMDRERPRFLDIVTTEESHAPLVREARRRRIPAITQKPMAPDLATCRALVQESRDSGVPFFVHENFRFQAPMRAVKAALDSGAVGRPFRGRIDMISGFPCFANQPNLKSLKRFVLMDLGSHILDLARFFFGEIDHLACVTSRVNPEIAGEDVATALLATKSGAAVSCHMALAGVPVERECFPQTLLFIEGSKGSIELSPDFVVRVTTSDGTHVRRHPPATYAWAHPSYAVVHASIVDCNANLLAGITGRSPAETNGDDNLATMAAVFACYDAAADGSTRRPPTREEI